MPRPPIIRTNIARLRVQLGLTQPQFADLVGKSAAAVQSLEICRLPLSAEMVAEIAQVTGVHPRWLLDNDLTEEPYDLTGKPWTLVSYQRVRTEIPHAPDEADEIFRQRLLEVAAQLSLARNTAGIKRLYRAHTHGRELVDIGRRIDQFIAALMVELNVKPDLNMIEEIKFAEREADRKTQNMMRIANMRPVG